MQPRDWKVRIDDILEAIARTQQYTETMTYEAFRSDRKTVDAVEYNLAIIGEAARQVPDDLQARYPLVPWAKMRGLRNVVIHEYSRVNLPIIWQTVQSDLPPLVPLLKEILERGP